MYHLRDRRDLLCQLAAKAMPTASPRTVAQGSGEHESLGSTLFGERAEPHQAHAMCGYHARPDPPRLLANAPVRGAAPARPPPGSPRLLFVRFLARNWLIESLGFFCEFFLPETGIVKVSYRIVSNPTPSAPTAAFTRLCVPRLTRAAPCGRGGYPPCSPRSSPRSSPSTGMTTFDESRTIDGRRFASCAGSGGVDAAKDGPADPSAPLPPPASCRPKYSRRRSSGGEAWGGDGPCSTLALRGVIPAAAPAAARRGSLRSTSSTLAFRGDRHVTVT